MRRDDRETVCSSTCTWTVGGGVEQDRFQIEIEAWSCFKYTQKTDAAELPSKKNIVNSSPFSKIDSNYPVERMKQIFVSLFRIKEKAAAPRETSSNLHTYRLSLCLSLSLFSQALIQWLVVQATALAAVSPREQYCRVKMKVPGGCDSNYPLSPHQRA